MKKNQETLLLANLPLKNDVRKFSIQKGNEIGDLGFQKEKTEHGDE